MGSHFGWASKHTTNEMMIEPKEELRKKEKKNYKKELRT